MKKFFAILLLLAAALPGAVKGDQFNLSFWLTKPVSDQALLTTSSPTFAGLTLSGLTASTLVYSNASKAFTSLANGAGYLLNDGSGGLSWAAVSLSGYLKADGTIPLTANWPMGAFELSQATWKGATIAAGYGGTGQASYAVGDMLYASGATTLSKLAAVATGQVLASAGTTTAPAYTASPTLTGTLTASNLTATPTLSNEALTNVAGWTAAGNWTYAGGKWSHSTGDATALTATGETAIAVGTKYEIVMTITTSTAGGGLAVSLGGQSFAAVSTGAPTTYTYNVTALSTAALAITPTSGTWIGSVDSISVKIVTNGMLNTEGMVQNSGQLLLNSGNITYPALAFSRYTNTGISLPNANQMNFGINGTNIFAITASGPSVMNTNFNLNAGNTTLVAGTDSLQMGTNAVSPVDQTFKAHNASGNDGVGAMLTLQGGQNKGSGAGGGVRIQTANTGASASTAGVEYTRYRAVGKVVTLTDAGATDVVSFAVTAGNVVGGTLFYTIDVTDDDASDRQVESGTVTFCGLQDEANWHTSISEVSTQALESGTLATTWAIDTATANTLKITCLADSDLTTPVIKVRYQLFLNSPIVETIL